MNRLRLFPQSSERRLAGDKWTRNAGHTCLKQIHGRVHAHAHAHTPTSTHTHPHKHLRSPQLAPHNGPHAHSRWTRSSSTSRSPYALYVQWVRRIRAKEGPKRGRREDRKDSSCTWEKKKKSLAAQALCERSDVGALDPPSSHCLLSATKVQRDFVGAALELISCAQKEHPHIISCSITLLTSSTNAKSPHSFKDLRQ